MCKLYKRNDLCQNAKNIARVSMQYCNKTKKYVKKACILC